MIFTRGPDSDRYSPTFRIQKHGTTSPRPTSSWEWSEYECQHWKEGL